MPALALVDTNILVYRFDARFPEKRECATKLLRAGIESKTLIVPHQALIEFVAAVRRPIGGGPPILGAADAHREVEEMLGQFMVVYPTDLTVRTALRGAALYKLPWFDAHLWAYADEHHCETLWSEDFQDGRRYGRVKVSNPFRT